MDDRSLKILQIWKICEQSGKIPDDQLANAVYYGVTENSPPAEIASMRNPGELVEYFKKIETGLPLTEEEHDALLQKYLELHKRGASPSFGFIKLLTWLPNIAIILALIAVIASFFSWIVLGLALLTKFLNSFAKYTAGKGQGVSGTLSLSALTSIPISLIASLAHIFSDYQFY